MDTSRVSQVVAGEERLLLLLNALVDEELAPITLETAPQMVQEYFNRLAFHLTYATRLYIDRYPMGCSDIDRYPMGCSDIATRDGWGMGMHSELAVGNAIWCEGLKAGAVKYELLLCLSLIYAFFYDSLGGTGPRETPVDWKPLFKGLTASQVQQSAGKGFGDLREWFLEDNVPTVAEAFVTQVASRGGLDFNTEFKIIRESPVGSPFMVSPQTSVSRHYYHLCSYIVPMWLPFFLHPPSFCTSQTALGAACPPYKALAPPAIPLITDNKRTQVLQDLLLRQQDQADLLVAWYLESLRSLEVLYQSMQHHCLLLGIPATNKVMLMPDLEATPRPVGGGSFDIPRE
ncbi:hypothetical protein JAAARDRAFT_193341 [Jaapia argillacea MUCL 33604]|uniref:Uncharacterized protein n=1 Tax=Jaapia argillacea MUCL 33604 TaxID=933084 RepID=A0A067PY76_9AGAM|nr:hypothetical protein JAAARDRAFT_193341 [Jaapia argillacea MUCL 33604]